VNEAQWVAWFAAHPFTRTLALVAVGTIGATVKADYNKFKERQQDNGELEYSSWVVVRKSLWSLVTAVVLSIAPVIWTELLKILGGGVLTP
jgi:hypothetical protein